ncbi:MAG: hypothetical protein QOE63_709 [Acidimicrobiaceae bacterium]|jgi:1-acyl-sn-glycerol-3-phosphate acyltransferase
MMDFVRRRLDGSYTVDEWGLDPDLVDFVSPAFGLRWRIDVEGVEHVPADGGAIVVSNRRIGCTEPFVLARGIRLATGRHVRVVGAPDLAPIGPALRRLGGVLERPDEVAGLLRAGELVGVALARSPRRRHHAGPAPAPLLAAAVVLGLPIVPVALVGREVGRRWRVVAGPVVEPGTDEGPLAAAELADRARNAVQALLDDAFPPSFLRAA